MNHNVGYHLEFLNSELKDATSTCILFLALEIALGKSYKLNTTQ